jgi:hypothetical protein
MQARYNYYSIHKDTSEHVLWPWHEWHKVLQYFFSLGTRYYRTFFALGTGYYVLFFCFY